MKNFKIQNNEDLGKRLDRFLVSKIPIYSRSKIQKNIKNGNILVNNNRCKTGYLLEFNDIVKVNSFLDDNSEDKLIAESIDLDIIHEDSEIIILNKPAELVVHPGTGISKGTLANGLKYHFKHLSKLNGLLRPGLVHRLDADTSGIMIITKTDEAHRFISNQFQRRKIKKEYIAITWGDWTPQEGFIDKKIIRKKKDPTVFCVGENGKFSYTGFKVKKKLNHFSIVSFFPKTGRTHQIRVHSSYLGFPIFGDSKYGGAKSKTLGYIPELKDVYGRFIDKFNGHALHANKISFIHPSTKKNVNFELDIPNRFYDLINSIKLIYER